MSYAAAHEGGRVRARTRRLLIRLGACVVISLVLAGATALLSSAGSLARFETIFYDEAFPRGEPADATVVVAIDDEALTEVGAPWPWTRAVYAELVRGLSEAGAEVIAFDVAFVDPQPGDDELAAAMREAGNVVLISIPVSSGEEDEKGAAGAGATDRSVARTATGLTQPDLRSPVPELADAAVAVAHPIVSYSSTDGVVRELPLAVEDRDARVVPALSLAAVATSAGQPPDPIMRRPSGVQAAGRAVPTDEDYELRISYADGLQTAEPEVRSDAVVSAGAVLAGEAPSLDGKVAFVGVTDVSLGDRALSPVAKQIGIPGVLVHANAFNTIETRNYVSIASTLETTLWVLLIALVLSLAVQFLPAWLAGVVAVVTFVAYLFGAYLRADTGTIMTFVYPTLAVALAVPLSGGVRYVVETRQRRMVSALFSQYIPPSVAEQLIDEGRIASAAEGARVDGTAIFIDLRGFTTLSSRMEATQVNRMLSDFYEYGSGLVLEHGGTLMTYIGDEIFAIFGAPLPSDDHAARALACAEAMQERVGELDATLAEHGFEHVRFGIGLNAGELIVSHAGSTWRRQYTAIGDTVNVASRLTGQAGPGQVVLSESVRTAADPPPKVEAMGSLSMKGVRGDFVAWKLVLDNPPSGTADR